MTIKLSSIFGHLRLGNAHLDETISSIYSTGLKLCYIVQQMMDDVGEGGTTVVSRNAFFYILKWG